VSGDRSRMRSGIGRKAVVAIAVGVALLASAYVVAGRVALDVSAATHGGCRAEHAAFTPASFDTGVWISDEFTADSFDVGPYLMPDYEEVSFPARNDPGVTIRGWWIPGPTAASPAVIVVHGLGSCRRDPAILLPAGMLHREGFGVLMLDMRGHGDSTGGSGRYAFGSTEYRDVLGGWDWLVARGVPPGRIGLFGQSGGAPGVVVAMGEEPRVAAAWVDSSKYDMLSSLVEEAGFPKSLLLPAAIGWWWALGEDVIGRNPLAEARRVGSRPLQVVYGTADRRVAAHHVTDIEAVLAAANPSSRAWVIEGAAHVQGPFLVPDEYEGRLATFFHAALGD